MSHTLDKLEALATNKNFQTNIAAKVKNINGSSWYNINIVSLSKSGACLQGNFTRAVEGHVELLVPTPNPNIKFHVVLGKIVSSDGDKTEIRFLYAD